MSSLNECIYFDIVNPQLFVRAVVTPVDVFTIKQNPQVGIYLNFCTPADRLLFSSTYSEKLFPQHLYDYNNDLYEKDNKETKLIIISKEGNEESKQIEQMKTILKQMVELLKDKGNFIDKYNEKNGKKEFFSTSPVNDNPTPRIGNEDSQQSWINYPSNGKLSDPLITVSCDASCENHSTEILKYMKKNNTNVIENALQYNEF